MNQWFSAPSRIAAAAVAAFGMLVTGLLHLTPIASVKAAPAAGFYRQTNLVSDQAGVAQILDSNLINAWGIALSPNGGPFWVANNVTGTATLYAGDVNGSPLTRNSLVVTIPNGAPTGIVFNGSTDFVVKSGAASGVAAFIFASQAGIISGWSPAVPPPPPSTQAQLAAPADAVYTGLAIGRADGATFLYACDFEHGRIDVYDRAFQPISLSGAFDDPTIPTSYAPFNVQNLGGNLYVTYAQHQRKEPDEETGHGSGFVNVFDTSGRLLERVVRGNHLEAPWGVALAPGDFGPFSGALLVGNHGSGRISAFDRTSGQFLGELQDADGRPIVIEDLWGLTFGNGLTAGDRDALYFAAGPDEETHGLFGSLRFVSQP